MKVRKYDIYRSNTKLLNPAVKVNEFAPQTSCKDSIDILEEFLLTTGGRNYHPANISWMEREVIFDKINNQAIYRDNLFFVKKHNKNIPIGMTIEKAQDNFMLRRNDTKNKQLENT
ncbi:hypothetical protein M0P65_07610 [Candidatus Gracilibacteria bacterium]|jgi:hypothetical protein|nr:hypothetical protein [Candidatus Gracilibacteria bacterium]